MTESRSAPIDAPARRVAGVDGCRSGWVVASSTGIEVVTDLTDVMARFDTIGIDMPIGLPPTFARVCEQQARRYLSPRASTVFPSPPRILLSCTTYAEANALAKERFGKGLTQQTFHLFPKIRELDALVTTSHEAFVVEVHPECAFRRLAGCALAPKRSSEGRAQRIELLEPILGSIDLRVRGAKADDVLDACAVLVSARRFAVGAHDQFGDGERDERGLLMRIVY
jgi:predicted RNase H-like nuclease